MTGVPTTRSVRRTVRRSPAGRRPGYVVAALINAVGLYLINVSPGWDAVPFLTQQTPQVLGIVNAMLISTLAVNLLYLFTDPRWLVALCGIGTTLLGLIGLLRIWQVFPFDFGATSIDWPLIFRVCLVVGIVGSCIAILVQFVQLLLAVSRRRPAAEPR